MDETLLFGDGVSERLVNASKFGFVLLPWSVHLLLQLLFFLLKLSVLG